MRDEVPAGIVCMILPARLPAPLSGMVITKFMCAIFSLFVCAEVQFTIYCAKCSANQQTSHGQTFYAKNLGRRIKKESKNDLRCIIKETSTAANRVEEMGEGGGDHQRSEREELDLLSDEYAANNPFASLGPIAEEMDEVRKKVVR
jgi:hypothetical protein